MLLIFSVFHPADSDIRPLVFYSERIELSIDLLNHYVKQGYTIVSAVVREPGKTDIPLPLEAIDGEPIAEYIRRMQTEWERILKDRS